MYSESGTLDGGLGGGAALALSTEDTANLRKAGKWARFIGIVTMVIVGLSLLFIIFAGSSFMALAGLGDVPGGASFGVFFVIIYGLILALGLYLAYLLFNFGKKAVTAVDQGSQIAMTESFGSLAKLYQIYGILMLIYVGFLALGVVGGIIGGAAAAF